MGLCTYIQERELRHPSDACRGVDQHDPRVQSRVSYGLWNTSTHKRGDNVSIIGS